jgi:cytochrome c-type biogenesis protein CcmH
MSKASAARRWGGWVVLAIVLPVALVVATRTGNDASPSARVARLTSEIRCPTCTGLSVAQSDAESAQAIRADVTRQVDAGQSDGQILRSIESTYGTDILLRPPSSGFEGLVWVLPVVALVIAIGALTFAFRRWRTSTLLDATPEDKARVARALGRPESAS